MAPSRGLAARLAARSALALVCALLAPACSGGGGGDASGGVAASTPDGGSGSGDAGALDLGLRAGCNPLATSDECLFPYPTAFFEVPDPTTDTGVRLAVPADALPLPPGSPPIELAPFNAGDGAPSAGPILVHLGVDVDPAQLVGPGAPEASMREDAPVALFDLDSGERVGPLLVEMDRNLREPRFEGRHALIIRPLVPMAPGARHVVVLSAALRDVEGRPLPASAGFDALRSGMPTTDARLEAARDRYERLFAFLDAHGYARQALHLAWDFHVASERHVLGPILAMRAEALARARAGELAYTVERVVDDPSPLVARVVEGTFEVPTYLDASDFIEYAGLHVPVLQPQRRTFPYTMVIPASARTRGPAPLALMGHGIFGTGRDFVTGGTAEQVIHPIAERVGGVMLATDWIGLSGGDLDLIVRQVIPDLNQLRLVTDRLVQSLVNNLVLTELALGPMSRDARIRLGERPLLDGERVTYFGASLGGIQGASFVALSPRIQRAVLSVPGCAWSTMINRSTVFQPIKVVADAVYPDPLAQQAFIGMLQSLFDYSDPVNLARLLHRAPLPDAPSSRLVVLQEAIGDALVPNLTTRVLARVLGVAQLLPALEPVYGLEPLEGPTTRPALAQLLLPEPVGAYRPPDTNTLPERDNGVHFEGAIHPSNLRMLERMMTTGEIVQFCDGPCDPD